MYALSGSYKCISTVKFVNSKIGNVWRPLDLILLFKWSNISFLNLCVILVDFESTDVKRVIEVERLRWQVRNIELKMTELWFLSLKWNTNDRTRFESRKWPGNDVKGHGPFVSIGGYLLQVPRRILGSSNSRHWVSKLSDRLRRRFQLSVGE